jgi:hypothetical protein
MPLRGALQLDSAKSLLSFPRSRVGTAVMPLRGALQFDLAKSLPSCSQATVAAPRDERHPPSNSASLIESLTEIGLKVLRWNNRNSIPFILTIDHIRR